jgi:hypothetical protein
VITVHPSTVFPAVRTPAGTPSKPLTNVVVAGAFVEKGGEANLIGAVNKLASSVKPA